MKLRLAVLPLVLVVALFGCSKQDQDAATVGSDDAMAEPEHGDGDGVADDDHHGDGRTDRDHFSKPDEVYAFLGIGAGDRVVDVMSGGGYNAERLAHLVGETGVVVAEGGSEEFRARFDEGGDLAAAGNIRFVDDLAGLEDGSLDAVVAVRAYHLFPDVPATLAELHRALVPGGVFGVVEVRLNQAEGHDMASHRVGEGTVIADLEAAGFEYVGESDILKRDDDDYAAFIQPGKTRYMTDRMLLKFRKSEGATE